MNSEIVFVNDGRQDNRLTVIQNLHLDDSGIAIVHLSRNFGKEMAMTAGLDYAMGDAVVVIDTDLQDSPELITELVNHWRAGYDVVYAKRTSQFNFSTGRVHAIVISVRISPPSYTCRLSGKNR